MPSSLHFATTQRFSGTVLLYSTVAHKQSLYSTLTDPTPLITLLGLAVPNYRGTFSVCYVVTGLFPSLLPLGQYTWCPDVTALRCLTGWAILQRVATL
jgi:hypothetical protein